MSEPAGPQAEPQAEPNDLHTVAARAQARQNLEADIEAFLAEGGLIQDVPGESSTNVGQHP